MPNLPNPYPDFKTDNSVRPFNDQSWGNDNNFISTSLMFPKKVYRSGKGCDFHPPPPTLKFVLPALEMNYHTVNGDSKEWEEYLKSIFEIFATEIED